MFNAIFVSAKEGISKKTGEPWYMVELIAETVSGKNVILQVFSTENAYYSAKTLTSMQNCKVASGVSDNGYLTVNALKGVE